MTDSAREGAVFLDRDGVIVADHDRYITSWDQVEVLPGAPEAVAALTRAGERVVIVTNQSAVGRGLMSRRTLDEIHERLVALLERAGGSVEAVMVCPHTPEDGCRCRKPGTGMLEEAAERLGLDLRRSFLVGDRASDIEAGERAGCQTVLVKSGSPVSDVRPGYVADDLVDAVLHILVRRADTLGRTEVIR